MRFLPKGLVIWLLLLMELGAGMMHPSPVLAQAAVCPINGSANYWKEVPEQTDQFRVGIDFDRNKINPDWNYFVRASIPQSAGNYAVESSRISGRDILSANGRVEFQFKAPFSNTPYQLTLNHSETLGTNDQLCIIGPMKVTDQDLTNIASSCSIRMPRNINAADTAINVNLTTPSAANGIAYGFAIYTQSQYASLKKGQYNEISGYVTNNTVYNNNITTGGDAVASLRDGLNVGSYVAVIYAYKGGLIDAGVRNPDEKGVVFTRFQFPCGIFPFTASNDPTSEQENSSVSPGSNLPVTPGCNEGNGGCTKAAGQSCGTGDSAGIQTAIGCIPTDPVVLVNRLLSFGVGAAGGIALLLMMFGSFEMVTSQGDPKALANGRERFVSALIGLLFILFSVVFLKIIGVDILGLDAISKGVFGR